MPKTSPKFHLNKTKKTVISALYADITVHKFSVNNIYLTILLAQYGD